MDEPSAAPWLLLIHQLPPRPPYLRVKVWRRLQALGAVPIKNSVYALPNTGDAREDFEWVLREIKQEGGEASLCEARLVDGLTDDEVRTSFQTAREADYRTLATEIRTLARETLPRRGRAPSVEARAQIETAVARFKKRLTDVGAIDFFGAPGRGVVEGLVGDLDARLGAPTDAQRSTASQTRTPAEVQRRVWVTRTGVHIDRIASAWLIRRFIDPAARFKFVPARGYRPQSDELRFDMFDAEFTHRGDLCTFEVLARDFGIADAGVTAVGELVHDIDVKASRFGRPETVGLDHLITGLAWGHAGDDDRLAHGAVVFDAFHAYFKRRRTG